MMLTGLIRKEKGGWYAECALVGAYTQGTSRKDALAMLADCVETLANRDGFKARVAEVGEDGDGNITVVIDSETPAVLVAEVLRHQRQVHKLTTLEVAKRMGSSSHSAYTAYERGEREPTVTKFRELLAAVAPELALTMGLVHVPRKAVGR